MDERTIKMNNEAIRTGSERLLSQLRDEGLRYKLWVTGADRGSTVHMRVPALDPGMKGRIEHVLSGRAVDLDVAPDA